MSGGWRLGQMKTLDTKLKSGIEGSDGVAAEHGCGENMHPLQVGRTGEGSSADYSYHWCQHRNSHDAQCEVYYYGHRRRFKNLSSSEKLLPSAQGLVFVVDASERNVGLLAEAKELLNWYMQDEGARDKALLVLAHKQDISSALTPEEVAQHLSLTSIKVPWLIQGTSVVGSLDKWSCGRIPLAHQPNETHLTLDGSSSRVDFHFLLEWD